MKIASRHVVVALVLAVHLGVDTFLTLGNLTGYPYAATGFAVIAWPMAQSCLIALWAATGRVRFSLRLLLALTGTTAAWIVLLRVFEFSVPYSDAAGSTFMLISQLLTVLLLVNAGRLVRRQFRLWRSGWTEADAPDERSSACGSCSSGRPSWRSFWGPERPPSGGSVGLPIFSSKRSSTPTRCSPFTTPCMHCWCWHCSLCECDGR